MYSLAFSTEIDKPETLELNKCPLEAALFITLIIQKCWKEQTANSYQAHRHKKIPLQKVQVTVLLSV